MNEFIHCQTKEEAIKEAKADVAHVLLIIVYNKIIMYESGSQENAVIPRPNSLGLDSRIGA